MAILRPKEIRNLGEKDREQRLADLRLDLAKERASVSVGGTAASPGKIREIRRTIARIRTIKGEQSRKAGAHSR